MNESPTDTSTQPLVEDCEFANWVSATHPALLRYTKRHLLKSLCNEHDAEDILQDALCTAWHKREELGLHTAQSLSHWVMRVVRNRVIDLARQNYTRSGAHDPRSGAEREGNAELEALADLQGTAHGKPPSQVEAKHGSLAPLQVLHHEERLCVVLRDFMGLEWTMIAATLGRSLGAAKSLRKRARYRLLSGE